MPSTRERVWTAARALDFEPNQMARSLRTRSSRLVGMVLPDVGVAAYASALGGAQSVLEQAGYQVMAMNTARSPEREQAALRTLYARNVDGVLVATSGGFVEGDVPAVFFDHVLAGRGLGFTAADNNGGRGHARAPPRGGPRPPARSRISGPRWSPRPEVCGSSTAPPPSGSRRSVT